MSIFSLSFWYMGDQNWVQHFVGCLANPVYSWVGSCIPLPPLKVPWLMKPMIAVVSSILPFPWHWYVACMWVLLQLSCFQPRCSHPAAEMLVISPWSYILLIFLMLNITQFLLLQFLRVLNSLQMIFASFSLLTTTLRMYHQQTSANRFFLSWLL